MKECRSCKVNKQDTEFTRKKCNSDGLYSYCKDCTREQNRKRFLDNREKYLETQLKYRESRRQELNEKSKIYYNENREECLNRVSEYRKKNQSKISLREALKRKNDDDRFEKNRIRHLNWSKENRERINEWQRGWYQRNKEKRRAHVILSRSIQSGETVRPETCSECKKQCKPDGHHLDYNRPLDVMWICRACHARKSPRTVIL